jgi:hypothetical protein
MYKPNLSFSKDILLEDYIMMTVLPNWDRYVDDIKEAEAWFEKNNMTTADSKTNVNSKYHTPYRSQKYVDNLDNLHSEIKREIDFAQAEYRGIKKTALWNYLEVGESWIAKYQEGDTTNQHVHYPYHIVSTFYYDVEVSTPIVFQYYDETGLTQKEVEVSNGLLIVQNGSVKHSVPQCKGARSVVASNWFYNISSYLEESA